MFTKCYFLNKARFQGNEYINSRFLNLDMDTQPALMPDEILICDLTIEDKVKKSIFVRFFSIWHHNSSNLNCSNLFNIWYFDRRNRYRMHGLH